MTLEWTRTVENHDSPYPEDRRIMYSCKQFALRIEREGDGWYWLRYAGKPLGRGPRLKDAKMAAAKYAEGL